jgi:hypothetical protein
VFDEQWGLVPNNGNAVTPSDAPPTQDMVIGMAFTSLAKEAIAKTLEDTEETKVKAIKFLKSTPDHHKGLEILQLFIKDLLGRDSSAARIFKSKVDEDYRELPVVKRWHQHVALATILLLNSFFIFFAILRGYARGQSWQRSYMIACVMQFLLDILLFETLECIWVNVLVPSVVTKEVSRIHMILHSAVQNMVMHALYDEEADSDNDDEDDAVMGKKAKVVMNAADYLFISTKVAKVFPQLMESVIVLSYQTYMPGEIAKHWGAKSLLFDDLHHNNPHVHRKQDKRWTLRVLTAILGVFSKFTGLLVTFLLVPMMSRIPLGLQKLLLRFIQPFILGGLAFLYYSIVTDLTYVIIAVVAIAVVLVSIGWKIFMDQRAARRLATMVAASPSTANARRDKILKRRNENAALAGSPAANSPKQGAMKSLPPPRSRSSLPSKDESKSNHSEHSEGGDEVDDVELSDDLTQEKSFTRSSAGMSMSCDIDASRGVLEEGFDDNEFEWNSITNRLVDSDGDEDDDTDLSRPRRQSHHHRILSEASTQSHMVLTSVDEDDLSWSNFDFSEDSVVELNTDEIMKN